MQSDLAPAFPRLGVAIVSFNAADVILDCLETLLASDGVALDIVLVDNASSDNTVELVKTWAQGALPYAPPEDCPFPLAPKPQTWPLDGQPGPDSPHRISLIEAGVNGGFAAGVNTALGALQKVPALDRFWVLNPDSLVPPQTAHALATHPTPAGGFAMIGGRVLYCDGTERIQIDGGTINRFTGVTGNLNLGQPNAATPPPDAAEMAFITGASLVASRAFLDLAGPMPEDYFLYYEEVSWALRRGALPLVYCPGGLVYHRAGTAIGSPKLGRPATPFSLYFKHRARLRFVRRHYPASLPIALLYSVAKAAQLLLKGFPTEALTILRGSFGLAPSRDVRGRLSPEAQNIAFPRR